MKRAGNQETTLELPVGQKQTPANTQKEPIMSQESLFVNPLRQLDTLLESAYCSPGAASAAQRYQRFQELQREARILAEVSGLRAEVYEILPRLQRLLSELENPNRHEDAAERYRSLVEELLALADRLEGITRTRTTVTRTAMPATEISPAEIKLIREDYKTYTIDSAELKPVLKSMQTAVEGGEYGNISEAWNKLRYIVAPNPGGNTSNIEKSNLPENVKAALEEVLAMGMTGPNEFKQRKRHGLALLRSCLDALEPAPVPPKEPNPESSGASNRAGEEIAATALAAWRAIEAAEQTPNLGDTTGYRLHRYSAYMHCWPHVRELEHLCNPGHLPIDHPQRFTRLDLPRAADSVAASQGIEFMHQAHDATLNWLGLRALCHKDIRCLHGSVPPGLPAMHLDEPCPNHDSNRTIFIPHDWPAPIPNGLREMWQLGIDRLLVAFPNATTRPVKINHETIDRRTRVIVPPGQKGLASVPNPKTNDEWAAKLPDYLKGIQLVNLCLTTHKPTTEYIARAANDTFWSVLWNSGRCGYQWEQVTEEYARHAVEPVRVYRGLCSWLQCFEANPERQPATEQTARPLKQRVQQLFDRATSEFATGGDSIWVVAIPAGIQFTRCELGDPNCGVVSGEVVALPLGCFKALGNANIAGVGRFNFLTLSLLHRSAEDWDRFNAFASEAGALLVANPPSWANIQRADDAPTLWAATLIFLAPSTAEYVAERPGGCRLITHPWAASVAALREWNSPNERKPAPETLTGAVVPEVRDKTTSPVTGPDYAKALIVEAITNEGKFKDGKKATVTELVRRLNQAGVDVNNQAIYENKEYGEIRSLGKRLGWFKERPAKTNPEGAIPKGSKNKYSRTVEAEDYREEAPGANVD
jgi:hypothetical protein